MFAELTQKAVVKAWELYPHAVSIHFKNCFIFWLEFNFN